MPFVHVYKDQYTRTHACGLRLEPERKLFSRACTLDISPPGARCAVKFENKRRFEALEPEENLPFVHVYNDFLEKYQHTL